MTTIVVYFGHERSRHLGMVVIRFMLKI